ncbi:hypothetical protein Ancab_016285, partial [Ancistrocladus abbreviatus]
LEFSKGFALSEDKEYLTQMNMSRLVTNPNLFFIIFTNRDNNPLSCLLLVQLNTHGVVLGEQLEKAMRFITNLRKQNEALWKKDEYFKAQLFQTH